VLTCRAIAFSDMIALVFWFYDPASTSSIVG
jgi:hypothetical protein